MVLSAWSSTTLLVFLPRLGSSTHNFDTVWTKLIFNGHTVVEEPTAQLRRSTATELNLDIFPANLGIDDILDDLGPFLLKHANTVSLPEICKLNSWQFVVPSLTSSNSSIQLAGALSLVQCPGAPRIPFFMGRPLPKAASPPNLVPQPTDSITSILERFGSVGLLPRRGCRRCRWIPQCRRC